MTLIDADAVFLVTGATGSIGFEIAAQAAEAGAVVGVHGSRPDTVAEAMDRLKARSRHARSCSFLAAPPLTDAANSTIRSVASGRRLKMMSSTRSSRSLLMSS